VGADPLGQCLAPARFRVGVIGSPQHGDEDVGATLLTRRGVEHRHGVAGPIDEQLLASGMRLPHRRRHGLAPIAIEVAKAAIAVAVDVLGLVLLPQQLQRHALPPQLLVDVVPIGLCPCRCGLERRRREQAPLQLGVVHPFRHRPGDADHAGTSLASAQRRPPCRDSFAGSESVRPTAKGGRIRSEQVADFRRNGRPDCVGISGRLGSDYAGRRQGCDSNSSQTVQKSATKSMRVRFLERPVGESESSDKSET
jgi:hypothetical protein